MNTNIEMILDFLNEYVSFLVIGLMVLILILIILQIVHVVQNSKMKKKYIKFMEGEDAKSLEQMLKDRMDEMDSMISSTKENSKNIKLLFDKMNGAFQKVGLVKYDAFNEMGGKLSFSLALLDEKNDGFILNAMHSREGCYTYIKEVVDGNSYIVLSNEEKEALDNAMNTK